MCPYACIRILEGSKEMSPIIYYECRKLALKSSWGLQRHSYNKSILEYFDSERHL